MVMLGGESRFRIGFVGLDIQEGARSATRVWVVGGSFVMVLVVGVLVGKVRWKRYGGK